MIVESYPPLSSIENTDIDSNMRTGGWIEQVEMSFVVVQTDDDSLPPDSVLSHLGPNIIRCGAHAGRPCDVVDTISSSIRKARFVNVHEKDLQVADSPMAQRQTVKGGWRGQFPTLGSRYGGIVYVAPHLNWRARAVDKRGSPRVCSSAA